MKSLINIALILLKIKIYDKVMPRIKTCKPKEKNSGVPVKRPLASGGTGPLRGGRSCSEPLSMLLP